MAVDSTLATLCSRLFIFPKRSLTSNDYNMRERLGEPILPVVSQGFANHRPA